MSGARALWRATGMTDQDFTKPIIAIANSFTQFVPGHVHLHDVGQRVKKVIDEAGGWGVEFNTIAVDDGIAMGHDGMLYSLPSRDLIRLVAQLAQRGPRVDEALALEAVEAARGEEEEEQRREREHEAVEERSRVARVVAKVFEREQRLRLLPHGDDTREGSGLGRERRRASQAVRRVGGALGASGRGHGAPRRSE